MQQGGATLLSHSDLSAQYRILASMAGYSVGLCAREASTVGQCQTVTSGGGNDFAGFYKREFEQLYR